MAAREQWGLFLDESGDFDEPEAPVCVAGLLVQEDDLGALGGARAAFKAIHSTVPYPPHASHLNQPAAHLAAWLRAKDDARAAHFASARMAAAVGEVLAGRAGRGFEDFLDVISRGWPSYDQLVKASAWLQLHHRGSWRVLSEVRTEEVRRTVLFLEELGRRYGERRCFVVAAAHGAARGREAGDRYLELLEVLFRRVLAILRARSGREQRVWVVAAERDVVSEIGRRRLISRDVAQRISAAAWPGLGGLELLRLVPDQVAPYDEHVHPFVVVADFIANRLRRPLASRSSWGSLAVDITKLTGLSAEAWPRWLETESRLPAVTMAGEADRLVAEAFVLGSAGQGIPTPSLTGISPGWARDQAQLWVQAAALARRA